MKPLCTGDRLVSKEDGTGYAIKQVRRHEWSNNVYYFAIDDTGWSVLVYPEDLPRYTVVCWMDGSDHGYNH